MSEKTHILVRVISIAYLAGTWWPSDRVEGLAILVLIGYSIRDFTVDRSRKRVQSTESPTRQRRDI